MTVFIKRYPSRGELPRKQGKEYLTDRGKMYDYIIHPNWDNVEYWLEEIELPSEEEVYSESFTSDKTPSDFIKGANFILNKLKGE